MSRLIDEYTIDEESYCCLDGISITQSVVFPNGFVGRGTFWKLSDFIDIPIFAGSRFCTHQHNICEAKIWIGEVQGCETLFPESEYDTIEAMLADESAPSPNWHPAFFKKNGVWTKHPAFDTSSLLEVEKPNDSP